MTASALRELRARLSVEFLRDVPLEVLDELLSESRSRANERPRSAIRDCIIAWHTNNPHWFVRDGLD